MFRPERIKELNDLEMLVHNYIVANSEQVLHMTIRELSEACHVSTSTILRACSKLGLKGFSELKFVIQQDIEKEKDKVFLHNWDGLIQVDNFLKTMNNESYRKVIEPAVNLIVEARHIIFCGTGTSGILGEYGSRYFNNLGLNSYSITDPFTPIPTRGVETTLAIMLSVSGMTKESIRITDDFKQNGAKVLSITNDEHSTIARIADYNLSYYMPVMTNEKYYSILNLTTQVPLVALIEILAHQSAQKIKEQT